MSELIQREDAIDAMYRLEAEDIETYGCSIPEGFDANQAVEALKALPSAEPERKKGKWVWEKKIPFERCRCSECGYCRQLKIPEPDYFCPNCGAEMRGE